MRHRFRRVGSVATLALGLALTLAGQPPQQPPAHTTAELAPASSSVPPQLHREGRWLVDQYGRVVTVHGLNLVWKHAPVRPARHRRGLPRRRRTVDEALRLQRRSHRHAVGRGHPRRARQGRPDLPAALAAGDRPAGAAADLDAVRLPPGHVARAVRRGGRPRLGGEAPGALRRRSSGQRTRSRWATGPPRSPRSSTASGRTPTASSTAGCRPGRSWRSGGRTSPTRWATT